MASQSVVERRVGFTAGRSDAMWHESSVASQGPDPFPLSVLSRILSSQHEATEFMSKMGVFELPLRHDQPLYQSPAPRVKQTTSKARTGLANLSVELHWLIVDNLGGADRLSLSQVNRYFSNLIPELVPYQQRYSFEKLLEMETQSCYNGLLLRPYFELPLLRGDIYACSQCRCLKGSQSFLRSQVVEGYSKKRPGGIGNATGERNMVAYLRGELYRVHSRGGNGKPLFLKGLQRNSTPSDQHKYWQPGTGSLKREDRRFDRRCISCFCSGRHADFPGSKNEDHTLAAASRAGKFCHGCRSFKLIVSLEVFPLPQDEAARYGACWECIGKFMWIHRRQPRPDDEHDEWNSWETAVDDFNNLQTHDANQQAQKLLVMPRGDWVSNEGFSLQPKYQWVPLNAPSLPPSQSYNARCPPFTIEGVAVTETAQLVKTEFT